MVLLNEICHNTLGKITAFEHIRRNSQEYMNRHSYVGRGFIRLEQII